MMDLVAAPWYPTKARFDLYKKRERRMCLDWLVSYFGARLFRPSPASRDELRAALSGSLWSDETRNGAIVDFEIVYGVRK